MSAGSTSPRARPAGQARGRDLLEAAFALASGAARLVTIVDQSGESISSAETVTVLNDLCVLAPGALVGPRLAWEAIDDRSAVVTFTNGRRRVTATVLFNERDELVDFWSDDRPDGPFTYGSFTLRSVDYDVTEAG